MEHFESLALPTSPTLIRWWFRYVDNVHSATRKGHINKLQEHLNSIDPCIKFTIELSGTDGFPFLDIQTKHTPNSIESTVYRKPTHTDRYLDYNSNHTSMFYMWISCKRNESPSQSPTRQPPYIHHSSFKQGKPQQKTNRKPNPSTESLWKELELSYHTTKASVNSTDTS